MPYPGAYRHVSAYHTPTSMSRRHSVAHIGHLASHGANIANHLVHSFRRGSYSERTHHKKKTVNKPQHMRESVNNLDDLHSGLSHNVMKIVVNHTSHPTVSSPIYFKEIYSGLLESEPGKQNHSIICSLGNLYQFLSKDRVGGFSAFPYASACNFLDLNQSRLFTGSQLLTSGNTSYADDKIVLKSCNTNMTFTNFQSTKAIVHLFFFESKSNQINNAADVWALADGTEGLNRTEETFTGAVGPFASYLGFEHRDHPGNFPQQHAAFRKCYKLLGSHRMDLAGASSEEVDVEFIINKKFMLSSILTTNPLITKDLATWTDSNISLSRRHLSGSVQIMMVTQGLPSAIYVGDVASGNVTYGATKIGYVVRRNFSLGNVPETASRQTLALAQNTIFQPLKANLRDINDEDIAQAPQTV